MLQSRNLDDGADRLEAAIEHLHSKLKREEAAQVEAFMRQFFARIAVADLAEFSAEGLYGAALSMWKFAGLRQDGDVNIRVYNPRVEEYGWKAAHTIVEIVNDDMPFLVDSVANGLNQWGYRVHLVIHPVVRVQRDEDGRRLRLIADDQGEDEDGVAYESIMHVQIGEQTDPDVLEEIRNKLLQVLSDVRLAVADWRSMLERLDEVVAHLEEKQYPHEAEEVDECRAFLAWMRENHFTFLGCRDYS